MIKPSKAYYLIPIIFFVIGCIVFKHHINRDIQSYHTETISEDTTIHLNKKGIYYILINNEYEGRVYADNINIRQANELVCRIQIRENRRLINLRRPAVENVFTINDFYTFGFFVIDDEVEYEITFSCDSIDLMITNFNPQSEDFLRLISKYILLFTTFGSATIISFVFIFIRHSNSKQRAVSEHTHKE